MSDTPRTDALFKQPTIEELAKLCRELERELHQAKTEASYWANLYNSFNIYRNFSTYGRSK